MKRLNAAIYVIGFVLLCGGTIRAQQQIQTLDDSLVQAGKQIQELKQGTKLAVLSFSSTSDTFSKYVIEELTGLLVQMKRFTIVDRQSLDSIRKEMSIQLSGDVSDESAQAVGRQIGAEAIIVGSLTNLGSGYRMWIKALKVETGQVEIFFRCTITNDATVAFLLHGDQKSAPAPVSASTPAAPVPASKPSAPKSTEPKVYKIGDTGPGGGTVYLVEGNGGWEVSRLLGGYTWEEAKKAAKEYQGGGKSDWRLPSKDDLNLIYENIQKAGVMNLGSGSTYWSSSQGGYNGPWVQRFSDGSQSGDYHKYVAFSVRAVRAF
jgi:TolB-like protein